MKKIKKINKALAAYLRQLDKLQKTVFSFYITRDYFDNQLRHEKNMIRQTKSLFRALHLARESLGDIKHIAVLPQLEHIYEIIFSLDLLKHRLFDHSTFEVCESEMRSISQAISLMISEIFTAPHHATLPAIKLDVPIQALEILFQNTLQFLTAEPIIFLFFIRDLSALNDELLLLRENIQSLEHETINE